MHYILLSLLLILSACSDSSNNSSDAGQPEQPKVPTSSASPTPTSTPRVGSNSTPANVYVYFTPREADLAFNNIYSAIINAKEEIRATVYSWSQADFSDALIKAAKSGTKVKIAIASSLKDNRNLKNTFNEIESYGGEIKVASVNLHEKFFIIDNKLVINGSANMSHGPLKKYSENIIFHFDEDQLTNQFNQEFQWVWNSAKDYISENDQAPTEALPKTSTLSPYNSQREVQLIASTLNFNFKDAAPRDQKQGQYLDRSLNDQSWAQRDAIIAEINQAQSSIVLLINHFNLSEIADALLNAIKRGVDVKIAADNVEVTKTILCRDCAPKDRYKEKLHYFISEYKKLTGKSSAPVRFKYYSHQPSHSYWRLNHHKTILIDYHPDLPQDQAPKLISGSFNFSKTAEHDKFDNMVIYRGQRFNKLYARFYEEFKYLYYQNRNEFDEPIKDKLKYFTTPSQGDFLLHNTDESIALSWSEILQMRETIRSEIKNINPFTGEDFFSKLNYKHQNCFFYSPTKNYFLTSSKSFCRR